MPLERTRADLWMRAMRRGDFAAAWRVSDAVLAGRGGAGRHDLPRHLQTVWDGRALEGRDVLVHCYHGLGDTLQFVRLLPRLRARARRVTLWTQPALVDLLRGIDGADRILPLDDGAPPRGHEAHIELMELPHWLRLDPAEIPPPPYLALAAPERAPDRVRHVGLAWRGGAWDPARHLDPALLAPLASRPVHWHSVQYGVRRPPPFACSDLACRDLRRLAQRMLGLDLVISVDTMTAHLAGALGLPVWLLLPTPCDWRWMERRADTPWYPRMRLWRQHRAGDWRGVVQRVGAALQRVGAATPPRRQRSSWRETA